MRYTILTFLWAVALVAYVQRSAISVPLQEIGRDLAAQDTWFGDATRALGFLQSAWHFGYAVMQIPAGWLADRIGGRRAIVLLAVLWSLATAVAGFVSGYWGLVAAWAVMGALQAGVFPCAVRSIGQVFGERERARASGWLGAGMLAGGAVAPVLTAWLLVRFAPWSESTGIASWRACLVVYCLPGLVWAAAYWAGTRSLGLDAVRPGPTGPAAAGATSRGAAAWLDPSLLLLCGQQFLRAAAMIFFVTWFPTFLRETRGVSVMQSGVLTTYAGIAAMLGVICGGYASDWLLARTGSKRLARQVLAAVSMATCAILIVLSSFVADVTAAIALISAGAFIACFGGVAGYTVAIDYGGDRVGMVFGAMNMAGSCGAMLFPVTVGWLVSVTGTWHAAVFLFAALMVIDAILWAVLNPRGRFLEHASVAVAACLVAAAAGGAAVAAGPDFNADVRPLLADRCFRCHGPDAGSRQADLRLDRRDDAVARRDGRAAIVPGDAAASPVHARIVSQDPDERMPPPDAGPPLTAAERQVIAAWITAGAEYEPHWAFVPPVAAPPPAVRDEASLRHPIDHFIQARLDRLGITPEPEADPTTLCRRLHLDLTGLPPNPADVDAFVAAWTAAAGHAAGDAAAERERVYAAAVDRLLASPRYGERMAGPWLDAARYADTNGYQTDGPRQMWRYRDWVIEAFNRNQPFDAFTIDQLAGDLLPEPTLAQRIATGFNRNHRTNSEGGIIPAEFLVEYVVDRVETTATIWLGLTAGCARCHDHKYDPLSQRDFYRLFDFFNRVPEPGNGLRDANSPPFITAPTEPQSDRLAELTRAADEATAAWRRLEPAVSAAQAAWVMGTAAEGRLPEDDFTLTHGLRFRLPRLATAVDGPHGPAVVVDGVTPLPVDHVPAFDSEQPFAATVWIEPAAADRDATVYAAMDADTLFKGVELRLVAGRPQVVLAFRILDDAIRVEAEAALPVDRWSHVAWSYDGSRLASGVTIHVDGRPVATRIVTDLLSNRFQSKQPLLLGGGGTAGSYRGRIAELRFYDRLLEPDESAIISCGLPVSELVAAARRGGLDAAGSLKLRDWFVRHAAADDQRRAWERMRAARESQAEYTRSLPTVMVMQDVPGLRKTHVLERGVYDKPGDEVTAGVPESFGLPLAGGAPADRLALARWLIDRRNPLTARVIVNRIWQQFFGLGLVKTVEDFGLQGDPPAHPELLDWLAVEFMDGGDGWDVKRLVRQIVTSAAYRRSARVSAAAVQADPENRLLARGPRFRLPAETVRDAALAVSGLLVERIGGPSVKPYQPAGLWEELAAAATPYVQDHGPDLWRRSLYVYRKRTVSVPMFATFDAAARETCQVRQSRTNTPLQALNLLNDVAFVEAARGLGGRMIRDGGDTPASRIAHGFRLAIARSPRPHELETLVAGFERRHAAFRQDPAAARALVSQGESPAAAGVDPAELAAYATVGSVLLNLDEFLTRE